MANGRVLRTSEKIRNLRGVVGLNRNEYLATGLDNPHNMCYMNSVIQFLINSEQVVDMLFNEKGSTACLGYGSSVLEELRFLVKVMRSGEYKHVSPMDFKKCIDSNFARFRGKGQHDAHELLECLMNQLRQEINQRGTTSFPLIYDGEYESIVRCNTCQTKSKPVIDPFNSLQVPISSNGRVLSNVYEGICEILKSEPVEEWKCTECKVNRKSTKITRLKTLPKLLVLQIKRFGMDSMGFGTKNSSAIDFPRNLEISDGNMSNNFELCAFISHYGQTGAGHYTASCKEQVSDKWYCYNDRHVNQISIDDERKKDAYILFYKKTLPNPSRVNMNASSELCDTITIESNEKGKVSSDCDQSSKQSSDDIVINSSDSDVPYDAGNLTGISDDMRGKSACQKPLKLLGDDVPSDDSDFETEHFKKLKKKIEMKKKKNQKSKQKSTHQIRKIERKTTPLQSVLSSTSSSKSTSTTPVLVGPQVPCTKIHVPVHVEPPSRAAPASVSSMSSLVDAGNPGPFPQPMCETSTLASKPVHTFTSYQQFIDAFTQHEIDSVSKYNIKNKSPGFEVDSNILQSFLATVNSVEDLKSKLVWKQEYKNETLPIPFRGIPFVLLNKRECRCHQGKDKDAKGKEKKKLKRREEAAGSIPAEHQTGFKSRNLIQPTKKLDCPAAFVVKKLLFFPGYSVSSTITESTEYQRKKVLARLRTDLMEVKASMSKQAQPQQKMPISNMLSSESVSEKVEVEEEGDFPIKNDDIDFQITPLTTSTSTFLSTINLADIKPLTSTASPLSGGEDTTTYNDNLVPVFTADDGVDPHCGMTPEGGANEQDQVYLSARTTTTITTTAGSPKLTTGPCKLTTDPESIITSPDVVLNYITKFPAPSDHENHHQGLAAGLIEPLDDRVREYIKTLVRNGTRRKTEILSRTQEFVDNNIYSGQCRLRGRFKPGRKTINNIIASVKLETKYSKFDQENLLEALKEGLLSDGNHHYMPKGSIPEVQELLNKLEASEDWDEFDDININFSTEDVKLCFVYQSDEMARLYRKYAVNLILLDATHKICKYTIPLYLLVVQTNVNFQVVAIIIVEDESSELLTQALDIVKGWNPEICPKYAMIDFDTGEIISLTSLFDGIKVFLCDFHREQAWKRWIVKRENGVFSIGEEILARLRRIAKSNNVQECTKAVADLRAWESFGTTKLGLYFEKKWEPELERWSRAYRPDDLFNCNTNNGTERLNESLKYDALDGYKNSSLTELIKSLAQNFLPDLYEKYISLNIKYTSGHKGYCSTIPSYMVNRPGPLVEDMLAKLNRVTPFMISSVYQVTPSVSPVFKVESINEVSNIKHMYTVRFGDSTQICSCDCPSFRIDRLLCKHFFAVFKSQHPFGFNNLSPLFLEHPYTTIDADVIGGVNLLSFKTRSEEVEVDPGVPASSTVEVSSAPFVSPSVIPLPLRRKNRSINNHNVFAQLKVITDKMFNIPELRDDISKDLEAVLGKIQNFESSTYGQGELGVRERKVPVVSAISTVSPSGSSILVPVSTADERTVSAPALASVPTSSTGADLPVRRYPNDLCIYDELPRNKGKRKHQYSNRFGEAAEVMRKQLRVNVPVPNTACQNQPLIVTESLSDLSDPLVFVDRDLEQEHWMLLEDVRECVADMLDAVEDKVYITGHVHGDRVQEFEF